MKFQRIIDALYHQPLAISRAGFDTIDRIARPILFEGKRPDVDFWGGEMPKMEMEDGIAVIPIFGPLMQHAALIDKQCGATSYDDIREDLETAVISRVQCAILNIASPGGQMAGSLETAEFIADISDNVMPVYAYTDSQMCSAAYMLAAGCDQIWSSRTALVGSIGVILGWMDESQANEEAGLKPMVFTSGKYKSVGDPGLPLTEEQTKYVQALVDDSFGLFAGHVTGHRTAVQMDSMQGQVFHGEQASALGLTDGLADTIEEVIEFFQG